MNHQKKVHVTFPVLNEEAQLEDSILKTLKFCEDHQINNVEFWIADNGSTDGTESIGRGLESRFETVKYLRLNQKGVGLALKSAWSQCQADYVGYMDLDLSTDLKHLKQVYDLIQEDDPYTLILGSRLKKGAKVEKRTLVREITSRGFNFWLRLNLQVGFTDGMCGFKFIEKQFYEQLAKQFKFTDQWFFATELAVRSEWMGAKILDLPVHWVDDPNNSKSSATILKLIRQYLKGIERLRQEKKRVLGTRR
ncbi:glycosyltransferase [Crocosphaera sp. XPORK-15E]|uniref:glycosyltransferase n=1 Tax=Crocosphaera sp. XPORK-15E TaxID=3110247 RepID=UPI002B2087C4|nr:glycosyltransferase [Crocosphaera sp. XPORK-15E]MEA5533140.1 glycosyltransferase [Crocosphaera sp. XPORK-15E]